ncbi:MAG: ABC transporter ATP-binding protein [Eubacteriaceae bacterium]|nr:ABC transporter ATP-binding protein [Eubacteriaceae bacterium]
MKKYWKYVSRYKIYFILGPLCMIIESMGEIVLPYLTADIINVGTVNGDIPYIIQAGLKMAGISLIMLCAGIAGSWFAINGASRLAADLRKDVFARIQKFSFSNIDKFSTGALITRITNDITQIQSFTQTMLRTTFRAPIMLIGSMVMAVVMSGQLAGVIGIVVPVLTALTYILILIASPRYTVMQSKLDALNSDTQQTITNIRVIKSFVSEQYEKEKFGGINDELTEKSTHALKVMIWLRPISRLAINITVIAVLWIGGNHVTTGEIALGTLTAFIGYLNQILNSLNTLANVLLRASRASASDKRLAQVMNETIDLTDDEAAFPDKQVESGDIEFKNVTFRYFKHNREKVLDNISFSVRSGQTVGIIGSTGSGKTTLTSLIPRLYDADEGEVLVDGVNVKDYSLYNLRESVSMVLQVNTLFSGSVEENLQWGNENATLDEIKEACRIARADEFIETFEGGYSHMIEQGGRNLSGGQRQRLCIARALLKKPKILILDDSTSAVDTATEAMIREGLKTALPDATKIIIAQRITSVIGADIIIVIDEGKIDSMGNNSELMINSLPYREIYYSQMGDNKEERNG